MTINFFMKPATGYFLALIIFYFLTTSASGQSYYFRHYQVENGLSNNTVFCCAQDARGFMWMGTKDGLNRFDGYSYKVFRNNPEDSFSIGDNFIRSLFIDPKNNLYAGTRNGLYRFNADKDNFTLLCKSTNEIRDIVKDGKDNLWFVAGQQLVRYNEKEKKQKVYETTAFFAATSVCFANNILWVATADGNVERYNESTNSFTAYNIFDAVQNTSKWIEKLYCMKNGNLLAGTSNYGVKMFNPATLKRTELLTYNVDKTAIFARAFLQQTDSECWIATESGIFIYDLSNGHYTNLQKRYNNPYSISDNAVYSLCSDNEGGVWAGTYFGGINYYPKQYYSFQKYFPDYSIHSISGNAVREICGDKYGNLWIGTEDAGLNKFDKRTGMFTQYKPDGTSNGIAYPNIHGLLADNDKLWIGTFEHGLDVMNIASGKVITHYSGNDNSGVLKSNFIVTILKSKTAGIFIGTRHGLYNFNPDTKNFKNINLGNEEDFVHSITEDKYGNLWISTMGNGAYSYDAKTGSFENFHYRAGSKNSLSNNSVTTIFEDSNGTLWFGTEGGGLCRYDRQSHSFTHYDSRDGFPGNTIFKILEDSHKNLWITTSKGLLCFNPALNKINIFTTANGLLSDQFNYNSGYKDSSGEMYFGCVRGMIRFNPDNFVKNNYLPPVIITSVQSNGEEVVPGISASNDQKIELPNTQSTFSIDFAALSFTAPEMIAYRFMMEGLDKKWTYLKSKRKVYFTDLSPGTYTFKVQAGNVTGEWNKKVAELTIKILPPFWLSSFALMLYILFALLLSYLLFKSYHARLNEKTKRKIELMEHQKETEIYNAKINFFTTIAHEIKTPLTLIKAPLEKIMTKVENNSDILSNLKIMERNTDRLVELTKQLLDFSKVETTGIHLNYSSINLNDLLTETYTSFKPVAEQKNVHIKLITPQEQLIIWADLDSLQKILNNLFSNALNYCSQKVEVELSLQPLQKRFSIEFRNDGFIIPEEEKEKIFEPFYRLQQTQNKSGSGIGLAFSKSLAALHKGDIFLKPPIHNMNVFVLIMPVQGI